MTAYLSAKQKLHFEDLRVSFKQANLAQPASCSRVFEGAEFDFVYNLAAETKYGQSEEVYQDRIFQVSINLANEAIKNKVKVFVEMSTAQVYDPHKKPAKEDSKLKPFTQQAKMKLKAEEELKKIVGLPLVILRPALVYGPNDTLGLSESILDLTFSAPRLIIGAVYRKLNEEMKFLWTKDLKLNTVHVSDVSRALWHVSATKDIKGGRSGPVSKCEIYNLCDKEDTDQGTINNFIEEIFGIKTGFHGTIISSFAKLNLESVTEDSNDKHLQPWAELCKSGNVMNTPLTPYLDKELLKDNALSVDGTKVHFCY